MEKSISFKAPRLVDNDYHPVVPVVHKSFRRKDV